MVKKLIVAFLILKGKNKSKAKDFFSPFSNNSRKWSIMESQIDQWLLLGKMTLRLDLGKTVSLHSAVLA